MTGRAGGDRARRRPARRCASGLLVAVLVATAAAVGASPWLAPTPVAAQLPSPAPDPRLLTARFDSSSAVDAASSDPSVSPDGGWVAFVSAATDLVDPPPAAGPHVHVADRNGGSNLVVDPDGLAVVDPGQVDLSAGGRFATFSARSVPSDPAAGRTVYVADLSTGTVTRVEADGGLVAGDPAISDDGSTIVYTAAPAATPDATQIRAWDRRTRQVTVLSRRAGADGNGASTAPAISGDGTVVAFTTRATNLVAGMEVQARHGTPEGTEVVALTRSSGAFSLVSATAGTTTGTAALGGSRLAGPDPVSADGRHVAFVTDAPVDAFAPGTTDGNATADAVVRDRGDGSAWVASLSATTAATTCAGSTPVVGVDGQGVAVLSSTCTDLGASPAGPGTDTYQVARGAAPVLLTHPPGEATPSRAADPDPDPPSVSTEGTTVAVATPASLHWNPPDDANGWDDVYVVSSAPFTSVEPIVVDAADAAAACPDLTRSIVADLAGDSVRITDADLGVDLSFDWEGGGEWGLNPIPGEPSEEVRAIVLEGPGADGVVHALWDHGIKTVAETTGTVPAEMTGKPTRVALCVPATPERGPRALPDATAAVAGQVVQVDVLANDEGDLDPASLAIVSASAGTAEVVDGAAGPVVAYTAPAEGGTATVTYEVSDRTGTTTSGVLTVTVTAIEAQRLTLAVAPTGVAPDADVPVTVTATNDTGAPVTGAVVSLRATAPSRFQGVAGSGWSCSLAGAGREATCSTGATVADGAALPALTATVRTPAGPQLPCTADAPAGPACVVLHAWNGEGDDEATADPPAVRAALPYTGGVLRAAIGDDGPFVTDATATYQLVLSNAGGAPLAPGTVVEVRSGQDEMPFVSGASPEWSCTADPDDATRATCASTVALAADASTTLPVLYTAGAGQDTGCAVPAPCATLTVAWLDTPAAGLRVVLAERSTTVDPDGDPTPPDVAVQISQPAVVWTGQSTSFTVTVANAGRGATRGPITVALALPAGLVASGRTAPGWTCSLGAPTTCTRAAVLAGGSLADPITILADVAADATAGTATATVATAGDAEPANNTATAPLTVRSGDLDDPDGPARLGIAVTAPQAIAPGATVPVAIEMANRGTTATAGPTTVAVLVPDGLPAGQAARLVPDGEPTGWACAETAFAGSRELRCSHTAAIGPGTRSAALPLLLTATTTHPGSTLDLLFTHDVDGSPVSLVHRLLVTPPQLTRYALAARPSGPIAPGTQGELVVRGTNVGTARPVDPTTVDVALPAGLTVADGSGGGAWTCGAAGATTVTCTTDQRPLPGTDLPPLPVRVAAAPDAPTGSRPVTVRATTRDAVEERVASASATLLVPAADSGELATERRDLPATAGSDRRVSYRLVATNAGRSTVTGDLEVVETFPLGAVAAGGGDGWTCGDPGAVLRCTLPDVTLDAAEDAPPLPVSVTLPAGLAGGTAQISGTAQLGPAAGFGADAVSVPAATPARPDLRARLRVQPTTLVRGATATATVAITNQGAAAVDGPIVAGLVLPRGVVPDTVTGEGWTCAVDATAVRPVAACRRADGAEAGQELPVLTAELVVGPGAPAQATISAGIVGGDVGSLDAGLARLAGEGSAALVTPVSSPHAVRGLTADAGPDQEVPERSATPDGGTEPTVVRLDGRGSAAGTGSLTWSWVQVEGPEVTWTDPAGTAPTASGGERPTASGATPTFTVPRLVDETSVALVFALTAATGDAEATDTVEVLVTPTPDEAPRLGRITTDLPQIATAPAAGTEVALAVDVTDPEGDAASVRWTVASTDASAAGGTVTTGGDQVGPDGGTATASLRWPADATFVVLEATATSARAGAESTATLVVGTAPPPPSITLVGPDGPVPGGEEVTIEATLDRGDPAEVVWRWEQLGGVPLDPDVLADATGPALTFTAPTVATEGSVVTVRAVATRVAGTSSRVAPATTTVRLAPLGAPAVGIEGDDAVEPGTPATLAVTGAPDGSTVRWAQRSGPPGSFSSRTEAETTFRASDDGVAALTATVTDPTGRVTSATHEVTIGEPFEPTGSTACTQAGSFINEAFAAAADGGALAATIGPVSVDLGTIEVAAPCGGASPSLTFLDASFSVADGAVTGTGLSGRISPERLCLTSGEITFPESWGLTSATLGTGAPICLALASGAPDPVTGSLTVTGLPFITLPDGVTPPTTSLSFSGGVVEVSATAGLPNGGSLAVAVAVDLAAGTFTGTASGRIDVMGTVVNVTGSVSYDGTVLDFEVVGNVPGPVTLAPGTTLSDLTVRVARDGLSVEGTVDVGGQLTLVVRGAFQDSRNWSFSVEGSSGEDPWEPLPGLTLDSVAFAGLVERADGVTTFDVSVSVEGGWTPVDGLTVERAEARLTNVQAPAECPSVPVGSVWLSVGGAATASFGGVDVALEGAACVAPGAGAWTFASTATLDAWKPIAALDVSVESVGLRVRAPGAPAPVDVLAFGSARAFGVDLGATVSARAGSVVVDAVGDLSAGGSGVGLPEGSSGHALFASAPRPGYRFFRPGVLPTIDPELAAVTVPSGISLYAGITLSDDVRGVIRDQMGLPDVSSVVVSVNLGDAAPVLRATVAFGDPGQGITLYESCGGEPCTEDTRTRLGLTGITLTLSATGSVGFGAEGLLELAAAGPTPASRLALTAQITLEIAGPRLTMSLFTTDGTWHGALGTPGLDLRDLVVQAGIDFSTTPFPTPSLGFGATIERLPDDWAETIGVDPDDQEEMRFALNISVSSPIIDLQIGVADGETAIDPLRPLGAPGVVEVDYASLVVAPFGGTLGNRIYRPGLSFGFAATIAGVDVDAALTVDPARGRLDGEFALGPITAGGLLIHDVGGEIHVDAANPAKPFSFGLHGSVLLPSLSVGQPGGTASAALEVTILGRGLSAHLEVEAADIALARVARLQSFSLVADATLGTGGMPDVSFALSARADILGTQVGIAGEMVFSGGTLESLSAALVVDTTIEGVALTGPGCGEELPGPGACVSFAYGGGYSFTATIDAEISAAGFAIGLSGTIDDRFVRGSGALDVDGVGSFALSGSLYTGDDADLAGITERDLSGTPVQVRQGDFRLSAAFTTAELGGFQGSLQATALNLGGTRAVRVSGWMQVPGAYVTGTADLTLSGGQVLFDFSASGSLVLDDYQLASVDVHLTKTATSFSATVAGSLALSVPGFTGGITLSGSFTAGGADTSPTYDLTGTATLGVSGLSVDASVRFTNRSLSVSAHLGAATVFDVSVSGTISAGGYLSASASTSFLGLTATVSLRGAPSGWSLGAAISYAGHTFASVAIGPGSFTATVGFSFSASGSLDLGITRIGGSFSLAMSLRVTIGGTSGSPTISAGFSGSGSVSGWIQAYECSGVACLVGEGWHWGPQRSLGSFGASIDTSGRACATIAGEELCVSV